MAAIGIHMSSTGFCGSVREILIQWIDSKKSNCDVYRKIYILYVLISMKMEDIFNLKYHVKYEIVIKLQKFEIEIF